MTKGQEAPAETQQDRFQLTKLKVCYGEERTKTGTQSVQSQQGYMWSFNQKDVVSEAFLENTPYRTCPRVWPGCLSCPSLTQGTREPALPWSRPMGSQLAGWKHPLRPWRPSTKLAAAPCSPLAQQPCAQPGALEHFRECDSPLPWAASANPGTIHRKSSSHLNLQWANIRCFPRSSLKKFHTHFWVTV